MARRRRSSAAVLPVVTALALGSLAAWPSAAAAPAAECSIRPEGSSGYLIKGSGFEPGKYINFFRNGNGIGGGPVGPDGTYYVHLRVDQGAPGAGVTFFAMEGRQVGARTTTCTVVDTPAATSACDPIELQKDAFALGHGEGLKDGRADGFEDAYRQSYDDAFKKKPGITADQCEDLGLKAFQDGYGKGYEKGFAEGRAKGGKEGKKEGQEDRRTGNASRNVSVEVLKVRAEPASGETDCSVGIVFTATVVASGAGTVRYHWERPSGNLPGTLEFRDDGAPRTAISQGTVAPGAATATLTQTFVVDSGPSQGKTAQATANVTCKK
ncbi:hypothetical protein ACIPW5_06515 [Streptomyces sp. NPDC090077]|uniref:hypothetical protein n=1 Tax=Streptomyces sp. NPDC090077 TaxID=3365938 RepID=UPI0037F657D6